MNILLWIIQGILAFAFFIVGIMKATMPRTHLRAKMGLWVDDFTSISLQMIGFVEIIGALGIILPLMLNIYPFLTPIAAIGLVWTMLGASIAHFKRKEIKNIILNLLLLAMAAFVFLGRFDLF